MNAPAAGTQTRNVPDGAHGYAAVLERSRVAGKRIVQQPVSPLLVFQAAARGDRPFVEYALTEATGFDLATVGALIDRGWIGLRTIYRAAGFDLSYLRPTETALRALREAGGSIEPSERMRHAELCLSRALTANENMPAEQADELLELLYDDGSVAPSGTEAR